MELKDYYNSADHKLRSNYCLETPRYPPSTAAALKAFDEYFTVMYNCVDPFKFIPKCIAHEIIEGDMYAAGASVFQTNEIKMEPVLNEIRNLICLNGVDVFEKLLKVLRSEPTGIYKELADTMESMCALCTYLKCLDG